ncbi:N-acetylmuramoyl-L-alanine amidase [Candidatus Velamenicoccus archaeovorus]|uniref:N-acetylmuramoyl-L-alanine amidase n=1 Tax=Velamenicoccus archaeovorus TaxID=1930593 RepID=UPI0013E8A8D1|nr:N-acetylmuramoyl-L-alanine amidase [Candidatus Velamenicoccus archaeovorus]
MKNKFFFVCALLLLAGGCATTSKFPYTTQVIHSTVYFPVMEMCQADGVTWDYDPLSQVLILKKDNKTLELLVGSDRAILGNAPIRLSRPVVLKDSVVWAPVEVRSYLIPVPCPVAAKAGKEKGIFLRPVRVVVLDPGHGGKDPGAIGKNGLREKDVVLDVAKKVQKELQRCGVVVYLTRDDDRFIPLAERPKIAGSKKADIFVSIHANATRSRWIEGFEVYYLSTAVDDNARALAAAENAPLELEDADFFESISLKAILWDMIQTENRKESIELAQHLGDVVSASMNLKMLGVKGAGFAVLKGAYIPSVLVEIGYLSNGEGERKLCDPQYRKRMAESIAAGIMRFKIYAEGSE